MVVDRSEDDACDEKHRPEESYRHLEECQKLGDLAEIDNNMVLADLPHTHQDLLKPALLVPSLCITQASIQRSCLGARANLQQHRLASCVQHKDSSILGEETAAVSKL